MLNDSIEIMLRAFDQLQILSDRYKCKCRNELLGKRTRELISDPLLLSAIDRLREELQNESGSENRA